MQLNKVEWSERLNLIRPKLERVGYKGNINLLLDEAPKLAIVGSRQMTAYGRAVIEAWMPNLVDAGVTIVSGFMYGVDRTAHQACLDCGGKTIAVLGWGIERKPRMGEEKLYQEILEVGSLIVSEYEGEQEGTRWSFPRRNRIVVGIADAVLVVEAAEKSGSMMTARLAVESGKKIMAVPGEVKSVMSEVTNRLIREGKAVRVRSAEEVLAVMRLGLGQMKMAI